MSVPVLPKIIRAITSTPVNLELPCSKLLACWNWALTGVTDPGDPIGVLYDYVNGGGLAPTVGTHAHLTPGGLADLDAVRNLFAGHGMDAYNAQKKALLTQCSTQMARALCRVYGLPVSVAPTDIEIGLKFEAGLVRGVTAIGLNLDGSSIYRPEHDWELNERLQVLNIGYEHMWIRFKKKTTVETWVNRGSIFAHHAEQAPGPHKTVTRVYVSQLMPEHITKLTALIQARKHAPPFVHPAVRQAWVNDATVNNCTWCNAAFTFSNRKHHCRACGKIFCATCAFKTEMVATPALQAGQPPAPAAVARVCDTCYTGNT